ncbi:hypothetical protein VTN77DRAFT_6042 [Rasamsonia byssochlamydoides]|uniref:uncharacterized protein n=1 Tax=Rasamsonia byssochlamydoides TaxID=89139 RepID=UPI003742C751
MRFQQWSCHRVDAVGRRLLLLRTEPRCAGNHPLRLFSTSNSTRPVASPYQPLDVLQDASIDGFREKCFRPERPAILPRACFRVLPACDRWFTRGSSPALDYDYLEQYADTFVPLELTQTSPPSQKRGNDDGESGATETSFQRFHAPLSLFLEWTRSAQTQSGQTQSARLYLAQCQLSDMPPGLREDLPTPDLVSQAGRGDIYDTNIWMGIPPTYTPLHRDPNPNLFVQLAGRKQVRLLAPDEGMRVFTRVRMELGQSVGREAAAFRGEEMMQGRERTLLEEVVWGNDHLGSPALLPEEMGYDGVLEAGDGLFIPKGWWHSIKGVGDGITASVNWWFR